MESTDRSPKASHSHPHPHPHILVFPYPAHGHMLALLDLTHQLALRGLTITILITPKNLPLLSSLLSSHPSSITPLVLPFPSHPLIPPGVEHVKDLGNTGNLPIMAALGKLRDPLIHWFNSHPNPPIAILSDFFLGWTQHLATHLNIPRIAFFSVGVFLASVFDYIWNNVENLTPLSEVEFNYLHGSPVFKQEHLPSVFKLYKRSDPDWEFVKDGLVANTKSWGCVFNYFDALGTEHVRCFKTQVGHDRVFTVGPLSLTSPDVSGRGNSGSESDRNDRVLAWLDGCPDGSVVYVCFGSQKLLRKEQMEALANGLEKSGTRFIWVVKTGTTKQQEDGYGVVPDGFEERVADRSMVIKGWAPQALILSHKAVGGFLSHSGWNSVLEGIVGGVMILAWPMEADQFVNARLLVEDVGVGVRVCEGSDSVPDSDELGRIIAKSMNEGGVKAKAKELKQKALAATSDGGSSMKDLDRFVRELDQLRES
ncbi:UDP-glucuronosyl/UDP-glucosyltransferase - like 10 [Theobroma cacao]|uniref:UDP-Glycosyltransferase superfamily protein, putative n=1 Tax=Theobroma cacao TaxID=3641 RepID=A0A061E987_THECC|nr:UDP-Glycosyltransferase superfamily protein, putative [Theobroma cacao]WRX15144.1 UDP-glucuronosyl/UDP-glucosyltransferase - like 10 [Theobroma cacao]